MLFPKCWKIKNGCPIKYFTTHDFMFVTDNDFSVAFHSTSVAIKHVTKITVPAAYPKPKDRSIKSDIVIPAVLVARITAQ